LVKNTKLTLLPTSILDNILILYIKNQFFCLFPVRTVEEGFQALSGVEVGEKDASGNYLTGTVGHWVQRCLQRHAV
jgi:hypothetical protein